MRCALPCLLLAGLLAVLPVPAGDDAETNETWVGMTRAEIVNVLGEPDKLKKDEQGNPLLVYKLVRLAPDAFPGPGLLVVDVPGVGLVGRPLDPPEPPLGELAIPSIDTDRHGVPMDAPGTSDQRHTISRDLNSGEVETTLPEGLAEGDGVLGKLTLKLRLGKDDRITEVLAPKSQIKPEG